MTYKKITRVISKQSIKFKPVLNVSSYGNSVLMLKENCKTVEKCQELKQELQSGPKLMKHPSNLTYFNSLSRQAVASYHQHC